MLTINTISVRFSFGYNFESCKESISNGSLFLGQFEERMRNYENHR